MKWICPRDMTLPPMVAPRLKLAKLRSEPSSLSFPGYLRQTSQSIIKREDFADRFRLMFTDDQPARVRAMIVAKRDKPSHPHPLLLGCGDLVPDALAGDLAFRTGAKDKRTLSVSRPIEVEVLKLCVTETNEQFARSNRSIRREKSDRLRVSRSIL